MQADLANGVAATHVTSEPAGPCPRDLKLRERAALTALLLGIGLLWPLPLGGVLLMVAGAFGLAISWEDQLIEANVPRPAPPRQETQ